MEFTWDQDLRSTLRCIVHSANSTKDLISIGVYKDNDWRCNGHGHILCTYSGPKDERFHNITVDAYGNGAITARHWCGHAEVDLIQDNLCWICSDAIVLVTPLIRDKRWISNQLVKEYNNVL